MLFRKRWDDLKKWKEASDNGLLVYGARQVGKTFLIRELCKQEFDRTFEFNFHSEPDALSSFLEIKNADDLIGRISLFRDGTPKAGKDVIFFDEIQANERVLTSLKYFYENAPEYHIIAAGSLLRNCN